MSNPAASQNSSGPLQTWLEIGKIGTVAILLMVLNVYRQDTNDREARNYDDTKAREERYLNLAETSAQVIARQAAEANLQANAMKDLANAIHMLERELSKP